MTSRLDQVLTVAQMRAAEEELIAAGTSVEALMQVAGRGAAEWVWRIGAGHPVTVLCGPGNNGGDGYVLAEAIREKGGKAIVIAATEAKTDAARAARDAFGGEIMGADADPHGAVFVDCLFGSGLTRPLTDEHFALLNRLAANHRHRVAIDLPSGVESDSGAALNAGLPHYDLTVCLGAWKFAHFLMPSLAICGASRLVDIGCDMVSDAARRLVRPAMAAPDADAHKYRRGLVAVVGGEMPGAALLAAQAAQGTGAGYVKLLSQNKVGNAPADIVTIKVPGDASFGKTAGDPRVSALLVGPGLGRTARARERLGEALSVDVPTVLDADGLVMLRPAMLEKRSAPVVATPHEGELAGLEKLFGLNGTGSKPDRARALARAAGLIVVAKGPDTLVADPGGQLACAPAATSWLSTAGTGDVLAGAIAGRLATRVPAFDAACEGVWLHGEAARLSGPALSAGQLAKTIPAALAEAL